MKKNTKKKVLTLTLVILLLSIAIVGGSLAWFTAEDEAKNVFTVGSIKIVQHEQQPDEDTDDPNDLEDFEQKKVLMPIVNPIDPVNDVNYEDKIVTVENTGKNNAYVRTHIAIPSALEDYLVLDTTKNNGWECVRPDGNRFKIGEVEYTAYSYNYSVMLAPGDITPPVLNGVYLKAKTDLQKNPTTGDMEFCYRDESTGDYQFSNYSVTDAENEVIVRVLTQAVQADGFRDAKHALESAFGTPFNPSNPFEN